MEENLTFGQKSAEWIANSIGWRFIIVQTIIIIGWIIMNVLWAFHRDRWDPYPFILLNLGLSLQAAYTGPILLVAAKRQDRKMTAMAKETHDRVAELHADHNTQMEELLAICRATHAKVRRVRNDTST